MSNRRRIFILMIAICFGFVCLFLLYGDQDAMSVRDLSAARPSFSFFSKAKPRIFCIVTTCPKYYDTRAKAVNETWGKRCDYLYFISTKDKKIKVPDLNIVPVPFEESYDLSWGKMKLAYQFIHANFMDKIDWVAKVDDDAFLIVENLKTFLEDKNTYEPVTYGQKRNMFTEGGYVLGGAYVLSKEALNRLVLQGFTTNSTDCPMDEEGYEDIKISKCLLGVGGRIGVSHDITGGKFQHFDMQTTMFRQKKSKIAGVHKTLEFQQFRGLDCCSTMSISFHYVSPELMHVMELLLYKIQIFGAKEIGDYSHLITEDVEKQKVDD